MRLAGDRVAAGTGGADDRALGHRIALSQGRAPESEQRHRVAVGRLDGDRAATSGDGSGERNDACRGRAHGRPDWGADIDAAMLAAGVRVAAVGERTNHRPVHGPGPGECGRRAGLEREKDRKHQAQAHGCLLLVVSIGNGKERNTRTGRCQSRLRAHRRPELRANPGKDGSVAARSAATPARLRAGAESPPQRGRRPPRPRRAR